MIDTSAVAARVRVNFLPVNLCYRLANRHGFPGIVPEFSHLSRSTGEATICPAFLAIMTFGLLIKKIIYKKKQKN